MRTKKSFVCLLLCAVFIAGCVASSAVTASAQTGAAGEKDPADFSWDNATVYFLLTDRFENGDPSNDHAYGRTLDADGQPLEGWNTAGATFHGGDFAGITKKIEEGYFTDLGVNAIWLSAPYEQIHGYCQGDDGGSYVHYAYHGYYALDYTETDKNFGTKEEFQTLVDTAHAHGIRIIMDVVMNHPGYNTVQDMEEFDYGTLKNNYQSLFYKLDGIRNYHNYIDYNTNAYDWAKWWGSDWIRVGAPGIAGYIYSSGDLEGSLESLPDFKTESTEKVGIPPLLVTKWWQEGTYSEKMEKYPSSATVSDYLVTWLAEWVEEFGIDGFRCDTAKHVELASWKKLKEACTQALRTWKDNNPDKALDDLDFWMTGENWGQGVEENAYYTEGWFDSMINFSIQQGGGLPAVENLDALYTSYAQSIHTKENFNVLSYLSSHDTTLNRQDAIYNGSAFLLLPGAVQIYYGDESNRPWVPSSQAKGDHRLRGDMNWDSLDTDALSHWQKVGTFRDRHIAVGAGAHTKVESSSGYAFTRSYEKDGVSDKVAACISAQPLTDVTIEVSGIFADETVLTNAYTGAKCVVQDGKATVNSGEKGTILLEAHQAGSYTLGDVNENGNIEIEDVLLMQRHIAKTEVLTDTAFSAADIDANGTVTVEDTLHLQKYLAKQKVDFDIGKIYA